MKLLIAIGTSYHISNPSCYFFEDQTMKRKWLAGIISLLGIGASAVLAQFTSLRQNQNSPHAVVALPRLNQQTFFLEPSTPKSISFLVEPGYESYVILNSKSSLQFRIFNQQNAEVQPGQYTYNVSDTRNQNLYIKTIRFSLNPALSTNEMWSVEMISTVTTPVSVVTGNEASSDSTIRVAFEYSTPELNEPNRVFVIAENFDATKEKIELRKYIDNSTPGPLVDLRDDGITPDEIANDKRFTGTASTSQVGSSFMIAKLLRKSYSGEYTLVQTEIGSYSVYVNSMRVIDAPQAKLLNHELYGVPIAIAIDYDIEVFTAGSYHISTAVTGNGGESSVGNNDDPITDDTPFYSPGRHSVRSVLSFDPNDVGWLSGTNKVSFNVSDEHRVIENFTSQIPITFAQDQLTRKRSFNFEGDRLVDTNGDGDPDAMEVRFSGTVYKAGNYVWGANIELSQGTPIAGTDRGNGDSAGDTGPLGVGLHHFKLNVPLETFWETQAKGTFDISVSLVIPDRGDTIASLEETPQVFKSQYYDLTLGQPEQPKTIASLIQAIKDAKTLRPADGIKAEMTAKIEEAGRYADENDAYNARGSMIDFGDILNRIENKFLAPKSFRLIESIWTQLNRNFQNGIFK
jgi:hypothetical protein